MIGGVTMVLHMTWACARMHVGGFAAHVEFAIRLGWCPLFRAACL
jgi:hypothetical protein